MSIDAVRFSQAANQIGRLDDTLQKRTAPAGSAVQVGDTMGQILNQAVEKLDQGQKAADNSIAKLVAGEPVDLHHVMLQMEEASINLNLAIQVRNKVIEAYQDIQRMQV